MDDARDRFRAVLAAPTPDLAAGCFAIAEHVGHGRMSGEARRATDEGRRALDELVGVVGNHVGPRPDLAEVVAQLAAMGFRGDRRTYASPRNSLLPEVLVRRSGIPITLAVVVIEVSGRLGVVASGVGMPGHFLVGDGPTPRRWFDLFHGPGALDEQAALARFRSLHGADAPFDPAFLGATPRPQILARILNNLANAVRSAGDPTALVRALELRDEIPAVREAPRSRVELAEALAAVGRSAEAADVLDELCARIDPRRRAGVEARVAQLRATLN